MGACCVGYWLAYCWLFEYPKQLPIQPQKPEFGAAVGLVVEYWFTPIWAEANPTKTKPNTATATKAITIFVFCMCFITILRYGDGLLW